MNGRYGRRDPYESNERSFNINKYGNNNKSYHSDDIYGPSSTTSFISYGPWDPKKEAENDPTWARIYVSNLPKDITIQEIQDIFGGIGIIAKEKQKRGYKDQWPYKIKLYTEDDGTLKGDCVITYEDPNAAKTAPSFFNGQEVRGHKITVEMAGKPEPPAGGWMGIGSSSSSNRGGRSSRGGRGSGGGRGMSGMESRYNASRPQYDDNTNDNNKYRLDEDEKKKSNEWRDERREDRQREKDREKDKEKDRNSSNTSRNHEDQRDMNTKRNDHYNDTRRDDYRRRDRDRERERDRDNDQNNYRNRYENRKHTKEDRSSDNRRHRPY